MKRFEIEVLKQQLQDEQEILKQLEIIYQEAIEKVNERIKILMFDETQSKIYQKKYQEALKKQLGEILENLKEKEYASIQQYLDDCYRGAFCGALYSLQEHGVPLIMPIDQEAVIKAVQLDSKLSKGLYSALGVDVNRLKKVVAAEIARGIATSMPYKDVARNVNYTAKTGLSNSMRIVRTEGHRIQQAAAFDCAKEAVRRGAEVVKVWNSTLDARTRDIHRQIDGQIRNVDEPFEIAGKKAMYPGDFGDPAEDCNCRCVILQRSKWGLTSEETQWLGKTDDMTDEHLKTVSDKLRISTAELRKYGGQIIPVRAENYADFIRQYNKIWNYENSEHKKNIDERRAGKK